MDSTSISHILIALIAASSPVVVYMQAKRTSSGQVSTSEAAQLWEENRAIKSELRERVQESERRSNECSEKYEKLRQKHDEARQCIEKLEQQVERLTSQLSHMRVRLHQSGIEVVE